MAEINKPDYSQIWASGGAIVAPSDVKIQTGWTAEVPPFQWENWSQNRQDQAITHILQKGISVWSATGEYYFTSAGERSYVQGSDGNIYVAVADSVNQNPVTDITDTYWKLAFATTNLATTTTAGIVQLATTANMTTGTSNTLIPPVSAISAQLPFRGFQAYTSPGSFTWTVPSGVTRCWVEVIGAGGSGAFYALATGPSGGGGGGVAKKLVDLTGVTSVAVVVGSGGASQTTLGNNGTAGGNSSFGAFCSATGGGAGQISGSASSSGAGTGGDINYGIGQGSPALMLPPVASPVMGGGAGGGGESTFAASGGANPTQAGMGGGGRVSGSGSISGAAGAVRIWY